LLGERLNGIQIIGSLLILIGVIFLRFTKGGWRVGPAEPYPIVEQVS
jgi:drug/metabolite transporter (DMT)-like permease